MTLDIPDEAATHIVGAYGYDESNEDWPRLESAIKAAAPFIVAAELDRLADDYRARWQPDLDRCNIDPGQCKFCDSIRSRIEAFALFVGARARELRGGTP